MTVKQTYESLLEAKRPFDFFGEASTAEALKKAYRQYARSIHPDIVADEDKYIADEAFALLNALYNQGLDEIGQGIYGVVDTLQIYQHMTPLFELEIGNEQYRFYENVFQGEVANIYRGVSKDAIVYLKVALDPADNDLLKTEYDTLTLLRHHSLPYVERRIKVNDSIAILMREVKGTPMTEILEQYSNGVPAEHVMWMLERLLGVVGYLHANCVVHGNIKPENIIINKANHDVGLMGFSFCIPQANQPQARYKIVNDDYTAPEVDGKARVMPCSDVYSIGKLAVALLGGDVASGGMPIALDRRIRDFIRKMLSPAKDGRPNDAWGLWRELVKLRVDVFGPKHFKVFE